jgi:4-diphosphocytidyl-2-C-methyl-D-erythritol kinase
VARVKLDSFAKINLYLSVRPKRRDNYHGITTVFERISLKDTITLQSRKDNLIKISTNNKKLPCDKSNFVRQAAELLRKKFKITRGLNIRIIKQVPLGSGMGGGSSNAACTLLGLNRLWKLKLSPEKLAKLGSKIGSDVPFFLYNCSFALGSGRGEKIVPWKKPNKPGFWHVIVVPQINVSTALIYRKWDDFKGNSGKKNKYFTELTRGKSSVKLISLALTKFDPSLLNRAISNSLEPVTESIFPEVRRIKNLLRALGAQSVMMSGSGPAVFAIVASKKEAVVLSRKISKINSFWKIFIAKTK